MARLASRERILCSTCDLPFYADRGACPYCGTEGDDTEGDSTEADGTKGDSIEAGGTEGDNTEESDGATADDSGFVFGNDESKHRARTTCPECGLDHYEDVEACPYCAYADAAREARSSEASERARTDSAPVERSESKNTEPTARDGDGGLFGRLKRALGL